MAATTNCHVEAGVAASGDHGHNIRRIPAHWMIARGLRLCMAL